MNVNPDPAALEEKGDGLFFDVLVPAVRENILSYLDFHSILSLRNVNIGMRAEIDHVVGLNVVINDGLGNTDFVRRVKVNSLRIDFLRKDYSGRVRNYLKYPSVCKELNVGCQIPGPLLDNFLTKMTSLVRIGLRGQALTCMDFFPFPDPPEATLEAPLKFPFRNLEGLSLELNMNDWKEPERTNQVRLRAVQNMVGFMARVKTDRLVKFHFEYLDGNNSLADEGPLAQFIHDYRHTLTDLSVKITFNKDEKDVEYELHPPSRLEKMALHLGPFYPAVDPDMPLKVDEKWSMGYGLFWTELVNEQDDLEVVDLSFRNLPFMFYIPRLAVAHEDSLRVLRLHELSLYRKGSSLPYPLDMTELAQFVNLEEIHLHHSVFSRCSRGGMELTVAYKKLVHGLVRRPEVSNLAALLNLPSLKRLSLWGLLLPSAELAFFLQIPSLESLDLRGAGVRGAYGVGTGFFGLMGSGPLPSYLGLKDIRVEDLNNDECPEDAAYYQGEFARKAKLCLTGQFIPRERARMIKH